MYMHVPTCIIIESVDSISRDQGRIQDLRKGGAEPNARKNFSHTPKALTTPLNNADSLMTKKGVLGLVATRNCRLE